MDVLYVTRCYMFCAGGELYGICSVLYLLNSPVQQSLPFPAVKSETPGARHPLTVTLLKHAVSLGAHRERNVEERESNKSRSSRGWRRDWPGDGGASREVTVPLLPALAQAPRYAARSARDGSARML